MDSGASQVEPAKFRLLGVSEEDRMLLDHLSCEFRCAYDHYLRVIRETGILSKSELERKTTLAGRRRNVGYPLKSDMLANTRQCARDKAVECVRLYNSLREKRVRTEFPEFMYETVSPRLNWRDGYRIDADGSISISVRKGDIVRAVLEGSKEDKTNVSKALERSCRLAAAELTKDGGDYFISFNLAANLLE
jgi:hypothetical protein